MTVLDEARSMIEWDKQTKAVAAHLERHGALYKHQATREGIEGYGIIEHPGARIFDLRGEGWEIRTEVRPTKWVLISKPEAKTISLGV